MPNPSPHPLFSPPQSVGATFPMIVNVPGSAHRPYRPDVLVRIAFKQEPKENLSDLRIGRIVPELGHGKRIGSQRQPLDFIVIGKIKSEFHSVLPHREPIPMMPGQHLKHGQDQIIGRVRPAVGADDRSVEQGVHAALSVRSGGLGIRSFAMQKIFTCAVPESTGNNHDA